MQNKSTYWMVFELIWRDFFKLYCAKHGEMRLDGSTPLHLHPTPRERLTPLPPPPLLHPS